MMKYLETKHPKEMKKEIYILFQEIDKLKNKIKLSDQKDGSCHNKKMYQNT